jgi:selenocysteine lyase/cysteine desulfurase
MIRIITCPIDGASSRTSGLQEVETVQPSQPNEAAAWRRSRGYLDTATYGLPPLATIDRLRQGLEEWADGSGAWRQWNDAADSARRQFAALTGTGAEGVAVGPSTSTFVGLVAASLPPGSEVVVPEGDFTSLLFPFLVQKARSVEVRVVPLGALADSVRSSTTLVAWSAVQSSNGRVAETAAVLDAAERSDALTLVDATQALGWLPLPLDRVDATVCSAYKWLCCPRGTAFMVTSPRLLASCAPHAASWFAAEDMHAAYYGTPLRLASSARRLDVSPAWHAWIGAVASLEVLGAIGVETIHDHNVGLADGLRAALDLPPTGSAIVSIPGAGAQRALAAAEIRASTRGDGCRLSFHIYNDDEDVAAVVQALRGSDASTRCSRCY